jgi:hypothetical protein
MDIQELKLNLFDKLASVTVENLLNQIHLLLKDIDVPVKPYQLNHEQINMVKESETDYYAGRTYSNETTYNYDKEWMKSL